jgi:hypothetical protein
VSPDSAAIAWKDANAARRSPRVGCTKRDERNLGASCGSRRAHASTGSARAGCLSTPRSSSEDTPE